MTINVLRHHLISPRGPNVPNCEPLDQELTGNGILGVDYSQHFLLIFSYSCICIANYPFSPSLKSLKLGPVTIYCADSKTLLRTMLLEAKGFFFSFFSSAMKSPLVLLFNCLVVAVCQFASGFSLNCLDLTLLKHKCRVIEFLTCY